MQLLRPEELEALICGFPEFDMEELRSIAAYEGYQSTDTTIESVTNDSIASMVILVHSQDFLGGGRDIRHC